MRENLESILVSSVIELGGSNEQVILDAFNNAVELLITDEHIFQEVPEKVYISSSSLREVENKGGIGTGLAKDIVTNFGKDNKKTVTFYDGKAVLLHDGLHASAFGEMSYIYRSKGIRVYLFSSKHLKVLTPYCYIDHNGFQLDNESWDNDTSCLDLDKPEELRDFFSLFTGGFNNKEEKRFICMEIIKILCNIKMPFHKAFFLEYLLTPPDVDQLSGFSLKIRKTFWDICLSQDFIERWGQDIQNVSMNILSTAGVAPSTNQLVAYISRQKDKDDNSKLELLLERLSQIETNIVTVVKESTASDVSNVFEIKPNIWGIGINGNEVYTRLKEWWSKKSA